jgi:hypothetical protein
MGVTSIRLNKNEEKVLNYLKQYFNCDSSTLLKKSLFELYEGLKDKEIIEAFEKEEKHGDVEFVSYENLFE